ncbi:hypothetical protein ABMA28_012381 [Loxostege sticticalis]|uniref:Uncharacterized protein n=1 Tax=Loxostege sticticalis TaxID=481309 RepID=A0ABD0TMP2_LOXSC
MEPHYKANPSEFADYLQSIVKLDTLERITQSLDEELADSQRAMNEIKDLFECIPLAQNVERHGNAASANGLRQEDVAKFLDAPAPKLLMSDMPESDIEEVDIDDVITSMKGYAEELRKNFVAPEAQARAPREDMQAMDLNQYASALDQLCKRLAHMKLSKRDDTKKNLDLEGKLDQLCQDVKNFSELVELRTTVGEINRNWTSTQQNNNALHYDNIINRLLSGINEVAYLLHNKN